MNLPKNLKLYCNIYLDSNQCLEYTEYACKIFRDIRKIEGICTNALIQAFDILTLLSNFNSMTGNSGGRSGSFFLYSIDKKYIMKTISSNELKVLLNKFLIAYHEHLYTYQESIISRILGVYTFRVNKNDTGNFIIMQSIYSGENIKAIYDIKGSKLNRRTHLEDCPAYSSNNLTIFKDIDFIILEKSMKMPSTVGQRLREIIEHDVKLLKSFNIMDYSLLIAIKTKEEYSKYFFKGLKYAEKGYAIGIIDFLQEYNNTKKIEGISKKILTMKPRDHISSINSEGYMQRFLAFVNDIISDGK